MAASKLYAEKGGAQLALEVWRVGYLSQRAKGAAG
jgi:hypothetical protein